MTNAAVIGIVMLALAIVVEFVMWLEARTDARLYREMWQSACEHGTRMFNAAVGASRERDAALAAQTRKPARSKAIAKKRTVAKKRRGGKA